MDNALATYDMEVLDATPFWPVPDMNFLHARPMGLQWDLCAIFCKGLKASQLILHVVILLWIIILMIWRTLNGQQTHSSNNLRLPFARQDVA